MAKPPKYVVRQDLINLSFSQLTYYFLILIFKANIVPPFWKRVGILEFAV